MRTLVYFLIVASGCAMPRRIGTSMTSTTSMAVGTMSTMRTMRTMRTIGAPCHKPSPLDHQKKVFLLNTCAEKEASERERREIAEKEMPSAASVAEGLKGQVQGMIETLNPEVVAIMSVYFVQGILGLSSLATTFFLKDELHLSPAQVAALGGITSLPWVIKPLYGFISDTIPLFGYRRRSYLFLAGILGSLSWLYLALVAKTPFEAISARTLASLAIAVSDVVVDSVVVERSRASQSAAGTLQSLCWGSRYFGAGLTAYLSGELLEVMTPRNVFLITSVFPLLVTVFARYFNETKFSEEGTQIAEGKGTEAKGPEGGTQGGGERVPAQIGLLKREGLLGGFLTQAKEVWQAAKAPNVLYPMLFVLAWQATPNASTGFFYFLTNKLELKPEFLGRLQVAGSLSSLLGVYLYQTRLKEMSIKRLLTICTLLSVPLGLTQLILINGINRQLGIPDQWFALGDDVILATLGEIAFMPLLVISAKVCPPGIEGTLFATLMSLFNLSGILGQELGAGLTSALGVTDKNFENLGTVVALCNLSTLFPLVFINNLDRLNFQTEGEEDGGVEAS